ncbi:hypothetical protein Tco_1061768, partial [Tanacetum coccineum]
MLEGTLVQVRLSQHWPPCMVLVLHRDGHGELLSPLLCFRFRGLYISLNVSFCFFALMDIFSLLIASDDEGVLERSKSAIPHASPDVVKGPIPPSFVLGGVV